VYVGLDDEQETGGVSALGFRRQAQTSVQGSLGLRVAGPWAIPGLPDATACVQGQWIHEFCDKDAELEAHFMDYPSAVFAVRDEGTRDSAMVGAGLCVPLRRSATFRLHYDVSIAAIETVHLFGAVLQYCW
jgi:outer membrane autotransporter protein